MWTMTVNEVNVDESRAGTEADDITAGGGTGPRKWTFVLNNHNIPQPGFDGVAHVDVRVLCLAVS